jgi:long-chain acyl-CoA synthetase
LNLCVYADASKAKPVAIIVPVEAALKKLAEEHGINAEHHDELIHNDQLNSIVLKQLQASGRGGKLKGIEIIDGVVLADEEWTPQNVGSFYSHVQIK